MLYSWLFLLIWTVLSQWFAYTNDLYRLSSNQALSPNNTSTPAISGKLLLLAFVSYLGVLFGAMCTLGLLKKEDLLSPNTLTGTQTLFALFALFWICFLIQKSSRNSISNPHSLLTKIWNRFPSKTSKNRWLFHMAYGSGFWLLSFPIATLVSKAVDAFVQLYVTLTPYEQVAISFLKQASSSPIALALALLAIVCIAPILEELLFRGLLQNSLERACGPHLSILLGSFCFALAHFARIQKWGNLSLIASLWVLGGYLGFLYQKRGSLWAPIGLHITFNAISAVRILWSLHTL